MTSYDVIWRHGRQKIILSCRAHRGLSTKGKIHLICFIRTKTQGRGSYHPPSPPCTTVGVRVCLYVRGLIILVGEGRLKLTFTKWEGLQRNFEPHFTHFPTPLPVIIAQSLTDNLTGVLKSNRVFLNATVAINVRLEKTWNLAIQSVFINSYSRTDMLSAWSWAE